MTKRVSLQTFSGLPGVKGGKLEGPIEKSLGGFIAALRNYRAVTAGGDKGSIMVWCDDNKVYHCHFMQFRASINEDTFKTKTEVTKWLAEFLPQIF